jgi:hypothetical protein
LIPRYSIYILLPQKLDTTEVEVLANLQAKRICAFVAVISNNVSLVVVCCKARMTSTIVMRRFISINIFSEATIQFFSILHQNETAGIRSSLGDSMCHSSSIRAEGFANK